MSEVRAATVGAVSGLVGVLAGALISGYFAYQVAQLQYKQLQMATAASSALSVRATLADKATEFFLANQVFLQEIDAEKISLEKISSAVDALGRARGSLSPLLDADLLIAGDAVADSAKRIARMETLEAGTKAMAEYKEAYKTFTTLYLRLRRNLERSAQLDLTQSQIKDNSLPSALGR